MTPIRRSSNAAHESSDRQRRREYHPRRFWQKENTREQNKSPEHLQSNWDTPRCRVGDGMRTEINDVTQEDANDDLKLI